MAVADPNVGFFRGARLFAEAASLLRRERSLRVPALAPFLISIVALFAAAAGIVAYSADLFTLVSGWMPWPEATWWYEWAWVAPLRIAVLAVGAFLFLVAAGVALVASFLAASLVASPFHEVLSRRVERLVTGGVVDLASAGIAGFFRDTTRVVFADMLRVAVFLFLQAAIVLVGLLPGAQVFAAPALVAVTIFFLPIEYASYALDRRTFGFRAKLAWARKNRALTLGFGAAGCLLCMMPLVNLAALPILVTAGTLLVLRSDLDGRG